MAGGLLKMIPPRLRPQPSDVTAAAFWGVAAGSAAIYMIQPFDWIKKQFSKSSEEQEK